MDTDTNLIGARVTPGWSAPVLYGATITVGLMAGLFFAWDVSVMPGLGRLDAATYLPVMADLIVAIENPAFYLVMVGALVLTTAAAVGHRGTGRRRAARWIWAGLVAYVVALVVTTVVHLPLNDALVAAAGAGPGADPDAARAAFEQPWRTGNVVRTAACVVALGCLARAHSLGGGLSGPAGRAAR